MQATERKCVYKIRLWKGNCSLIYECKQKDQLLKRPLKRFGAQSGHGLQAIVFLSLSILPSLGN